MLSWPSPTQGLWLLLTFSAYENSLNCLVSLRISPHVVGPHSRELFSFCLLPLVSLATKVFKSFCIYAGHCSNSTCRWRTLHWPLPCHRFLHMRIGKHLIFTCSCSLDFPYTLRRLCFCLLSSPVCSVWGPTEERDQTALSLAVNHAVGVTVTSRLSVRVGQGNRFNCGLWV